MTIRSTTQRIATPTVTNNLSLQGVLNKKDTMARYKIY